MNTSSHAEHWFGLFDLLIGNLSMEVVLHAGSTKTQIINSVTWGLYRLPTWVKKECLPGQAKSAQQKHLLLKGKLINYKSVCSLYIYIY